MAIRTCNSRGSVPCQPHGRQDRSNIVEVGLRGCDGEWKASGDAPVAGCGFRTTSPVPALERQVAHLHAGRPKVSQWTRCAAAWTATCLSNKSMSSTFSSCCFHCPPSFSPPRGLRNKSRPFPPALPTGGGCPEPRSLKLACRTHPLSALAFLAEADEAIDLRPTRQKALISTPQEKGLASRVPNNPAGAAARALLPTTFWCPFHSAASSSLEPPYST